jgi:hypothetical protein
VGEEQRHECEHAAEHEEAALRTGAHGLLGLALDHGLEETAERGRPGVGLWRGQGNYLK